MSKHPGRHLVTSQEKLKVTEKENIYIVESLIIFSSIPIY
jgi:hypothetical protein